MDGESLIGRGAECARIDHLLADARAGRSAALVLRGEPGIGKSALLAYAARSASGIRALRALGVEAESELPFAGLHELIRPLMRFLSELEPGQSTAIQEAFAREPLAGTSRFAVYAATLALLATAAEDRPLLCLVDDAYWLDGPSAEALLFCARRFDAEGVAMLFAARDEEGRRFEATGIEDVRVVGLGEAEARALLSMQVSGKLAPAVADRIIEASGGNPLALIEIPQTLSADELAGTAELEQPLSVGERVERAYAARLRTLPEDARTAMVVASVSGDADLRILSKALELFGLDLSSFGSAEDAGLVRVREGKVSFRHPLVRSAAYHTAGAGLRRSAHGALARALQAGDPVRRAWHLVGAATGPDEEVAKEIERASEQAGRKGGLAAQAGMLESAATLSPNRETRARCLYGAGKARWFNGSIERAQSLLERALALTDDPMLRADIQFRRAQILRERGPNTDPCLTLLVEEASRVERVNPERAASMFGWATIVPLQQMRPQEALELARRAERIHPLARASPAVLDALAWARLQQGEADARELALRCASLAEQLGEVGRGADVAQVLIFVEEFDVARRLLENALAEDRATGEMLGLGTDLWALSGLHLRTGELRLALAACREAVDVGEGLGSSFSAGNALPRLAVIEAVMGLGEDCRSHAAASIEFFDAGDYFELHAEAASALGRLALGMGNPEDCVRHLEPVSTRLRELGVGNPAYFQHAPDLIEALVQLGRRDQAERELAELAAQAERTKSRWVRAVTARCQGLLAPEDGFDERFATSLACLEPTPSPFERARTELCWGERLRRTGRRVEARTHLRSAFDAFDRIGAEPWAEQAARELRASGLHARRRPPSPDEELTPQELQIALAVAGGLSNREAAARLFLSPKTIEKHLSSVYRKLGIRSRVELVRRLGSRTEEGSQGKA